MPHPRRRRYPYSGSRSTAKLRMQIFRWREARTARGRLREGYGIRRAPPARGAVGCGGTTVVLTPPPWPSARAPLRRRGDGSPASSGLQRPRQRAGRRRAGLHGRAPVSGLEALDQPPALRPPGRGYGWRRRTLDHGGVLLRDLIHLVHGGVHLLEAGGLFLGGGCDLGDNAGDVRDLLHDAVPRHPGVGHETDALPHLFARRRDEGLEPSAVLRTVAVISSAPERRPRVLLVMTFMVSCNWPMAPLKSAQLLVLVREGLLERKTSSPAASFIRPVAMFSTTSCC